MTNKSGNARRSYRSWRLRSVIVSAVFLVISATGCVVCGCFGNMCTSIYCVLYFCAVFFVLFRVCIFILICFVCTSVRTNATE